jgi:PAS domain-containing protein
MSVATAALTAPEVLDLLPIGICIIDEKFRILAWNRQLQDWTGLHSEDVLETTLDQHFPSILQDRFRLRLLQVFTSRTPAVFTAALHQQFLPVDVRNSNPPATDDSGNSNPAVTR